MRNQDVDNRTSMTKMCSIINITRTGTNVNLTTFDQHPANDQHSALAEGFIMMPMETLVG
jgi:hypothetical protein